jgi:hypothetical protein
MGFFNPQRVMFGSLRVMEPGLLKLGNGAGYTGRQHDALDQMIGQLGCNRLVRQPVRVDTYLKQLRGVFPDRVVAGHEHHAVYALA